MIKVSWETKSLIANRKIKTIELPDNAYSIRVESGGFYGDGIYLWWREYGVDKCKCMSRAKLFGVDDFPNNDSTRRKERDMTKQQAIKKTQGAIDRVLDIHESCDDRLRGRTQRLLDSLRELESEIDRSKSKDGIITTRS